MPDTVFNLTGLIDPSGLASLVRGLLPASSPPDFDWLSHSELLRGKLGELLSDQKLLLNLSSPSSSLKRASPPNHKCLSITTIGCLLFGCVKAWF